VVGEPLFVRAAKLTMAQVIPRIADVPPRLMPMVVNIVAFQIGWFACVLGAAHGWLWAGPVVVAAAVGLHLALAAHPFEELKIVVAALVIGAVWESLLLNLDLVRYPSGLLFAHLPPLWMLALWAVFATTINSSLGWLKQRLLLAGLLGALAGPLSYWAGARLGALELVFPVLALAALAVGWGVITPLLLTLARRFGYARPAS
jgi:hypothetical protein